MNRHLSSLTTLWIPGALAGAVAVVAAGQLVPEPLLVEGDSVDGLGAVTRIDNLAVNAQGLWLAEVDTDNADTEADGAILKDGQLFLREGQALNEPAGAFLDSFDAVAVNNHGFAGWNFFLDGTSGSGDDSGVYLDEDLVLQEGTVSIAPEFSAGTPYVGFFETKINDSNAILVMASVDDPAIDSTVDRALVVWTLDASTHELLSERVLAKEGDLIPGLTSPVADFGTGPHDFDYNNRGDALFAVDAVDSSSDAVVLYNAVDDAFEVLAKVGDPSPVDGRNWSTLSSSVVSVNNFGHTAFTGRLDGDTASDNVIIARGKVFAQEGQTPPGFDSGAITTFGTGPIIFNDRNEVLWYASWNDGATQEALFIGGEVVAQTGVTTTGDGRLITDIYSVQDSYTMSDNGQFIVFEAELDDSVDAVLMVERSISPYLHEPVPGLAGQVNTLEASGVPFNRIAVAFGFGLGSTNVPGCPGLSVEIDRARLLAIDQADAAGTVEFSRFVPGSMAGRGVFLQPVDPDACTVGNLMGVRF